MADQYVEIYKDKLGEWRWTLWGANHSDVLADSGEGYVNRQDMMDILTKVLPGMRIKERPSGGL